MGLRSRQRRRAGISHEDSFDIETSKHRTLSLEEHLQASRRDVDDLNLAWKHAVGMMGLMLALYEFGLWYQTLVVAAHAPPSAALCLVFKLLAAASLLTTRKYVQTGSSSTRNASLVSTAVYVSLWALCGPLLSLSFTLVQVSPVPVAYFVISHLALKLIGGNTKAEVARAQQLEKLEQLFQLAK